MGASGWEYWIPYQPDIEQALQELRLQVKRDYAFDCHIDYLINLVKNTETLHPHVANAKHQPHRAFVCKLFAHKRAMGPLISRVPLS